MNNISMQTGTGVTNAQKPSSSGMSAAGNAQGLMGFIASMMQGNPMAAQANPADLAAKVAALLQKNGATADLQGLQGLQGLLKGMMSGAGLTSDLTSLSATQLQQLQSIEQQVANMLDAANADALQGDMAAMLNAIEPGAGAGLDADIMAALQAKFAQFKALGKSGAADMAAFKAELGDFLLQQGIGKTQAQQYMTALAQDLRATAALEMPAAAQQDDAAALLQTQAAAAQMAQSAEGQNLSFNLETAEQASIHGRKAAPAAPAGAQTGNNNAAAMAQTTAAPQNVKATQTPTHPAVINGMLGDTGLQGGAMDGGFGNEGFGQQGGYHPNGSDVDASGLLKQTSAANPQGFVNYMTGARAGQSPTTQMVGVQISRNANAKIDNFTMQLNPLELGELEVRMKFDRDGKVKAHLIAEKPETLAMLQKDTAHLERILQQAGLEIDENALSFDLREQNQQSLNERGDNPYMDSYGQRGQNRAAQNAIQATIAVETYGYVTQSGVNIMV